MFSKGVSQNEEGIMDITNAMQNCTLTPQKGGEHNNDRSQRKWYSVALPGEQE